MENSPRSESLSSSSLSNQVRSSSDDIGKRILDFGVAVYLKSNKVKFGSCAYQWSKRFLIMENDDLVLYDNQDQATSQQGGKVIPLDKSRIKFVRMSSKTHMIVKGKKMKRKDFKLPRGVSSQIRNQIETLDDDRKHLPKTEDLDISTIE